MTDMTLFHTPTSPFALKVRVAIRERGLESRVQEVPVSVRCLLYTSDAADE